MKLKREQQVKRCAIIIGNDRWGGDFLPGVAHDIDAIKAFLRSPYGGAWNNNEIFEVVKPINKSTFILLMTKTAEEHEYVFIYFGGHGELSGLGVPTFVLPGGECITLDEIKQGCINKPTFMISDSCQGIPHYKDGGVLTEGLKMFSVTDPVLEFRSRRMFDKELQLLPTMFTYASAVSPGQFASEGDNGGLYTQNLINACKNIIDNKQEENGVYGICYPHSMAALAVRTNSSNRQRPCISGYNRTYQPPFLVKL